MKDTIEIIIRVKTNFIKVFKIRGLENEYKSNKMEDKVIELLIIIKETNLISRSSINTHTSKSLVK